MSWQWLEMTDDAITWCLDKGDVEARACAAARKTQSNNLPNQPLEARILQNQLGKLCEVAGVCWLGGTKVVNWQGRFNNAQDYDIGAGHVLIDVKGVNWNSKQLICPPQELKESWVYLLIGGELHPRYAVIGWTWGWLLKQKPPADLPNQPGRPVHAMPAHELREPAELHTLCMRNLEMVRR